MFRKPINLTSEVSSIVQSIPKLSLFARTLTLANQRVPTLAHTFEKTENPQFTSCSASEKTCIKTSFHFV